MKRFFIALAVFLLLSGCPTGPTKDEQIRGHLDDAQQALSQGNYSTAIESAAKALELDSENAKAHLILTESYLKRGVVEQDPVKSAEHFAKYNYSLEKALELEPENEIAVKMNKIREGDYRELSGDALEHLEEGENQSTAGNYPAAIQEYIKVIEFEPFYSDAYLFTGDSYFRLQDNESAIFWYTRAFSINPKNKRAYHYAGDSYVALWKIEDAIAAYEKALEIDPGYAVVREKLNSLIEGI